MKLTVSADTFQGRLLPLLFGPEAFERIAYLTKESVQQWYASLPADWFDNPEPFPDRTPRHAGVRTFMYPLTTSWIEEADKDGFSIQFKEKRKADGSTSSNWGLRLQQYGGTITPKKKRALTIPVTAEARGKSARQFVQDTGRKLFAVGKKEGDKAGTLVWEDPAGDLHAAYVLRTRSEVPPLKERRGHDAIPSDEQLSEWAGKAFSLYLKTI